MFDAIDTIARVIGYSAIGYGILWLWLRTLDEKREVKADQEERDRLNNMPAEEAERIFKNRRNRQAQIEEYRQKIRDLGGE